MLLIKLPLKVFLVGQSKRLLPTQRAYSQTLTKRSLMCMKKRMALLLP
ncbi:cell surface protein [Listeria monocytogenes]|nr:cell surface protein [Listeria monocytogenes]